ncbi:MAG: hypothetical protein LJE92_00480 [Gammaproteobacteria bacterium]|jgi:hypothetical protein|nr:hypothetical protein [Gammaproteobacteria bacterium]
MRLLALFHGGPGNAINPERAVGGKCKRYVWLGVAMVTASFEEQAP